MEPSHGVKKQGTPTSWLTALFLHPMNAYHLPEFQLNITSSRQPSLMSQTRSDIPTHIPRASEFILRITPPNHNLYSEGWCL